MRQLLLNPYFQASSHLLWLHSPETPKTGFLPHLPHANPNSPTTGYKWTDGTAWNYKNWNTGEPNDLSGEDDCVEYNKNANWNDQNCYVAKPFVCKVQLGKRCKTKRIQHWCPMGNESWQSFPLDQGLGYSGPTEHL